MPCPSMGPNHFGRVPIVLDGPNLFWSGPNHFGQVQIILDRSKSFWTGPNHFGQAQIINISPDTQVWTSLDKTRQV
jgi:hypothetical protein